MLRFDVQAGFFAQFPDQRLAGTFPLSTRPPNRFQAPALLTLAERFAHQEFAGGGAVDDSPGTGLWYPLSMLEVSGSG